MALRLNDNGRGELAGVIDRARLLLSVDELAKIVESEPIFQEANDHAVDLALVGIVPNATVTMTVTPGMVTVIDRAALAEEATARHDQIAREAATSAWQTFKAGWEASNKRHDRRADDRSFQQSEFYALYPGHYSRLVDAGVFK